MKSKAQKQLEALDRIEKKILSECKLVDADYKRYCSGRF